MLSKRVPRKQTVLKEQLLTVIEKSKEPEQTLEVKFKDLCLNLPVLEVLDHAPMYNVILNKNAESLELGKNRSAFIQDEIPKKMKDPELFTLPCRLGDSKTFDTLANLGSCVNLIPLYLFKKLKIRVLEETDHVFGLADGTKSYPIGIVKNVEVHIRRWNKCLTPYYAKKDFTDYHLAGEWEIARDAKLNLFMDVIVFRRIVEFLGVISINLRGNMWESKELIENRINLNKPPKGGDGAWHAKIRLIDPDGEEFTKTF
ncbi:MAK10-like protein [Tanacetum coccineum]